MPATTTMRELGIVGNENGAAGGFDPARVQHIIDITRPVYAAEKVSVPANLTPDQIATNRFIDPKIGFPS